MKTAATGSKLRLQTATINGGTLLHKAPQMFAVTIQAFNPAILFHPFSAKI
jgi:hypothetical protein